VASVELPVPYQPNDHRFTAEVANSLRRVKLRGDGLVGVASSGPPNGKAAKALALAESLAAHPVSTCPDLKSHLRAAWRADQKRGELQRVERSVRGRSESLARQFDRVLRVLEAWGYVDGWSLTDAGERLRSLYHESDLLVAECLRSGLFDGLSVGEVAGLASVFTFETRGPGTPPAPWFPPGPLRERFADLEYIARELALAEEDAGLPQTRPPDAGFVALAYSGSFVQLAMLSIIARMFTYVGTAAAVPILRRKFPRTGKTLVLPGGAAIPVAALLLSFGLLASASAWNLLAGAIALAAGALLYRTRRTKESEAT
jgi:ATP-dependent RNA helicase HelY